MICKHIVIHHSATADSKFNDWKAIRKFHIEERGWNDIGYHAGIEMELGKFHIRYGRELTENGAHCPGMNTKAAGFCFIGNFTEEPPPLQMLQVACEKWILPTMQAHGMTNEDIYFHHEKRSTECPGKAFPKELLLYVLDSIKQAA